MANEILKTLTMGGTTFDAPQGGVTGVKGQQESAFRTGDVNLSLENIAYIGNNPTGGVANDTKAFWEEKGTCYATITSNGQVNGQPAQYGILISYSYGANMLAQYFLATSNGTMYRRGNNAAATTAMPEFVAVDNDTKYTAGDNLTLTSGEFALKSSPALKGTPTTPNISNKSTSNTQIANSAFVQGAINRRLPKTGINVTVAQFSIASATYVYKNIYTAPAGGVLFVTGEAQFSANTSGYRLLGLQYVPSGGSANWLSRVTNNPVSNGNTFCNTARVTVMNAGDKVRAAYWQGSGSTLTVLAHGWQGYFITG